jgi:hypothetical protein
LKIERIVSDTPSPLIQRPAKTLSTESHEKDINQSQIAAQKKQTIKKKKTAPPVKKTTLQVNNASNKTVLSSKPTVDLTLRCCRCGQTFIFSKGEQEFFNKKGFAPPKKCKTCRRIVPSMTDEDYYERGLKHNSYQSSLDVYGPRICVNPAPDKWC